VKCGDHISLFNDDFKVAVTSSDQETAGLGSWISNLDVLMNRLSKPTRRRFLFSTGMLAAGWELSCADAAQTQNLAPTPHCRDGDEPTARQTDGPFFKPKSPERSDLREPGAGGRPFELFGFVMARSCRPVGGVVVDLWHADEKGEYDNAGFRYRGHVLTGLDGRFRFRTIVPAVYSGRTRHYHVKVKALGSRLLTTQLYFPNEPANLRDGLFQRELLMQVADADDGLAGRFDFVLDIR
jgi:protocatechuate 3,4-dioxygenase beta subunit